MPKKKASEIKSGNKIKLAGKSCTVESVEISDIGKQGTRKVRISTKTLEGEKIVIVRPEDYPIDSE
jgi:translation elongation factor P/translation initiation factor 5A